MAVLNTLRTNKYLKILTFSAVGLALLGFLVMDFFKPEDNGGGGDVIIGSVYGFDIEQNQIDLNGRTVNPWNFGTRMELFNFYNS